MLGNIPVETGTNLTLLEKLLLPWAYTVVLHFYAMRIAQVLREVCSSAISLEVGQQIATMCARNFDLAATGVKDFTVVEVAKQDRALLPCGEC